MGLRWSSLQVRYWGVVSSDSFGVVMGATVVVVDVVVVVVDVVDVVVVVVVSSFVCIDVDDVLLLAVVGGVLLVWKVVVGLFWILGLRMFRDKVAEVVVVVGYGDRRM